MLRKIVTSLHRVPYTIFLALFIIAAIVMIYALRQNNQTMVKLRAEVYAADQADGDVNSALNKLREYVYGHMNTDLSSGGNAIKPPIQLKYTYERLLEAEQQKAIESNSKIYTDAQNYCQALMPAGTSGRGRIPCVQDYVTSRGVKTTPIPTGLYQFDFISPTWSPDLAGWSLVVAGLMLLAAVASFLMRFFTRRNLKELL
ncbi:hypothetical protein HYS84_03990 [Candidatus Saccharibacteria bacterium]|nr:hypothetical protein [Candidatus Saccharibacteria bacterium]